MQGNWDGSSPSQEYHFNIEQAVNILTNVWLLSQLIIPTQLVIHSFIKPSLFPWTQVTEDQTSESCRKLILQLPTRHQLI